MDDEAGRAAMSEAARVWARPDAAARVADLVAAVARRPGA
jgi:UDP-N-acetylglucosamine:LPS N-acetylglucosamine transferase